MSQYYYSTETDLIDLGHMVIDLNKFVSATILYTELDDTKHFYSARIRYTHGSELVTFTSQEEQERFMDGLRKLCRPV